MTRLGNPSPTPARNPAGQVTTEPAAGCPAGVTGRRKTVPPDEVTDASERAYRYGIREPGPGHEAWRIGSLTTARDLLRQARATTQAGFTAEEARARSAGRRQPILFEDGEAHRTQRTLVARYFAPRTVERRYQDFMTTRADELIARVVEYGEADLSEVTLRFSVEVAAQVVGLEDADMPGMSRRLMAFFDQPGVSATGARGWRARLRGWRGRLVGASTMTRFFTHDVRPAIRERRLRPREDVVSHLIAEGASDADILIECTTYAAAGMVTTREFISMAAWHLLEDDALRAEYLAAPTERRHDILKEILRLEPIVGHLYRRAVQDVELRDGDSPTRIPAGALLDVSVRAANTDPRHVGEDPLALRPGRRMPSRIGPEGLSFGDGHHRCPGNHLAITESDVFLTRLLALPVRLLGEPRVGWDELISAYAVRDMRIAVGRAGSAASG